ncbi:MAG: 3-methyl-2-oxobutanoate hydroxymethyltransferase [Actinomycetes bacterium]
MSNATTSRTSIAHLSAKKRAGEKWPMLTCYEQITAGIFDEAGIPVLLVGDSAGNNFLGEENTIPVTVDEMIPLARAVVRGSSKALVVADFPFGSYESGPETAVQTGIRFFKEAKVQAVKLEGGRKVVPQILALIAAGIPVMGHLGLTPQSVHALGGFKVQGRGDDAERIKADARALQEAGCFALVLELVPEELATAISRELTIPVIGIGAGAGCDAQVLVWTDLMGMTSARPRLAKAYRDIRSQMIDATREWASDVVTGQFPSEEQTFH